MNQSHANTLAALLTGTPHFHTTLDTVLANRLKEIMPKFAPRKGDFVFDGNRCKPENIGWRFVQYFGKPPAEEVAAGKWDSQIEEIYFDAASAEHWYKYEKNWD